jgi:hypothetical protein
MKNFIVGFVIGAVLASALTAYAAVSFRWVNGQGVAVGTLSNPVHVVSL